MLLSVIHSECYLVMRSVHPDRAVQGERLPRLHLPAALPGDGGHCVPHSHLGVETWRDTVM